MSSKKSVGFGGFMNFSELITVGYESILHLLAEITVYTLQLVGIIIIIVGSAKAIIQILSKARKLHHTNVIIELGKALALALEFKMGAEIVNTVIVRDLAELGTLAIVIALRAILSLLIHWEIKSEKKFEKDEANNENTEDT